MIRVQEQALALPQSVGVVRMLGLVGLVAVSVQLLTLPLLGGLSPALARAALAYKSGSGIRFRAGRDIMALAVHRPAFAMVDGRSLASSEPVTNETLERLVADGDGFGSLGLIDESSALAG